ncbi:HTH-type transcriptional regulator YesS [bioreactor metagenome]|uniref:HTH-type transcriptional regulator YesS n=1 Tax=bioreactor metagenome TaxID=1076179 RepID=A0A644YLS0_9ZZZZ
MMIFFKKGGYQRRLQILSLWVALPILLVAILLHFYLIEPIQKAYQDQHTQQVEGVVENINQQLSQLEVSLSVWGQSFQERYQTENYSLTTDYMTLNRISEELFYLTNSSNYVKNIGVYSFGDQPFGLESGGTFEFTDQDAEKFNEKYQIDNDQDYQWKFNSDDELLFIQNIGHLDRNNPSIYMVAVIDQKKLLNFFDDTKIDYSATAISFDKGRFSAASDSSMIKYLAEEKKQSGSWIESHDGDQYSVTAVPSERLNQTWIFYSMVPLAAITQPVSKFASSLVAASLILIVVMVFLSQFFAKKQYQPFGRTMEKMFGDNWEGQDELTFLAERWQQMTDEQGNLKKIAARSSLTEKRSIVRRILEGYYGYLPEEELRRLLRKKHWNLDYDGYQLFFIQINGPIHTADNRREDEFTLFALDNIVNDITGLHFEDGVVIPFDGLTMLTFAMVSDQSKGDAYIQHLFEQINRVAGRYVTIVATPITHQFRQIPELVEKLRKNTDYQHLKLENQQLALETGRMLPPKYPISCERNLITALKSCYFEELQENISLFIRQVTDEQPRQFAVLVSVERLYDHIEFQLNENGVSSSDYLSKDVILKRIRRMLDPDEISRFLFTDFLKPITLLWQEKISDSANELIQDVALYMQREFQNEQISLETVADQFKIDPVYLSKEFKRIKKVNFIDYLTDIRIAEAKRLLLETDEQINLIAEGIGYNPSYFNRLFKKINGMTPGQFRKGRI